MNVLIMKDLIAAHSYVLRTKARALDPRASGIETIEVVLIAAGIVVLALALVAVLTGFFDRHKAVLEQ